MSEKTTKACIRCGAALPEEAAFCPVCTASQMERQTMALPRRRRRVWPVAAGCLLLVALALPIGAALWSSAAQAETPPPEDTLPLTISRESEDGAEPRYGELCQTYYEGEDGQLYHVFAAFSPGIDGGSTMRGYCSGLLEPGCTDTGPLTLFVEEVGSGRNGRDSFSALLEDWSVTVAAPDGGERCTLSDPTFDYISTTDALLYQELTGTSACADNEILWTLQMKNGDVVTVKQGVTYSLKTVVEYHWEDTPMSTAAELQALLDDIAASAKAEEAVYLYLPAADYDAPVSVNTPMTLVGQEGTTFSATLTASVPDYDGWTEPVVALRSLTFSGTGGTGVNACGPVYLRGCRFTGWDVAAQALDGGWIFCQEDVRFDRNAVAMRLNSNFSISCGANINNTSFTRNGVALQLERIPGERMGLILDYCTFYGNGTDIENPENYTVELLPTTSMK
jgi:predicted nucleic acid-binding Zn ribbon protein